jgi:hypothetical protein
MNEELSSKLVGHWVHSHEEDTGDQMVFRPATYTFPRSRGRQEFKLQQGGELQSTHPGPTDKRESSVGKWSVEPGEILQIEPGGAQALRLPIVSVDNDKLVVRRQ